MADLLYARWWFKHYGLYTMDRPFFLQENRRRVADQAEAHRGFETALRAVALEALAGEDQLTARKALSALAVVGLEGDIDTVRAAGEDRGGNIAKDARTAVYEIEHRSGGYLT